MLMEKTRLKGTCIHYKVIKTQDPLLLYIQLQGPDQTSYHCLLARQPLDFIYQVPLGSLIECFGHYNSKGQFIIEKYLVLKKANPSSLPSHLSYPHKKID